MATGIRTRHARSCKSRDGRPVQLQADLPGAGVRRPDRPAGLANVPDAERGEAVAPGRAGRAAPRHDAAADGEDDRRGRRGPDRRRARRHDPRPRRQAVQAVDRSRLRAAAPAPTSSRRSAACKLTQVQRRDVQDFVDDLRTQGLSASTIANILDPLRVIFRRAIRRDEISIDPTDNLDLPAIRGRRDRIEPPEVAHELLAALPDSEKAFWAVALFCGLRRGELRGLQWINVDFDAGVIRVERSWDPVKGPVDVKTGAGRRAVPMAFVVRRELMAHKARTGRDGPRPRLRPHRDRGVLRVDDPGPREQGLEASRARADHAARGTPLRDLATSSPPASTGSRSRPGPATAMSARPGTATDTSSPAAKTRPGSVSTPS